MFFFAGTYDGVIARVFLNGVQVVENDLSVRYPLSFLPGLGCALMSGFLLTIGSRWLLSRYFTYTWLLAGLIAAGGWGRVPTVQPLQLAALFATGALVALASMRLARTMKRFGAGPMK